MPKHAERLPVSPYHMDQQKILSGKEPVIGPVPKRRVAGGGGARIPGRQLQGDVIWELELNCYRLTLTPPLWREDCWERGGGVGWSGWVGEIVV